MGSFSSAEAESRLDRSDRQHREAVIALDHEDPGVGVFLEDGVSTAAHRAPDVLI